MRNGDGIKWITDDIMQEIGYGILLVLEKGTGTLGHQHG